MSYIKTEQTAFQMRGRCVVIKNNQWSKSKKRGCPICAGNDPKSCTRCFGRTRLCDWYNTPNGWTHKSDRKPSPETDRCGGWGVVIKHQLEYSIWSCRVSWCPICLEHFYNSRNEIHTTVATVDHYFTVPKPAPEVDRCGGVNGRIFTPQIKGV